MYILADLEWIEDRNKKISFTQIAMIRMHENWKPEESIYHRIKPINPSFHQWKHVAFAGGSSADFLNAPNKDTVLSEIKNWLCPDDVICWWFDESQKRFELLAPHIKNKQITLTDLVANFLGDIGKGNPYRVGKRLFLDRPVEKHDSRNDVEMMRRVLEHIHFPQPIPEIIPPKKVEDQIGAQGAAYHAHIDTNRIHKKGCPLIPSTGHLKGYNELTKPVRKGYIPCDCVKAEFRTARMQRNRNIIDRTEYCFLYSSGSGIFHHRDCRIMLNAKDIKGSVHYYTCVGTGRRPCKICNPSREHETLKHVTSIKKVPAKKTSPGFNSGMLTAEEQRAVKRHRQAFELRKSVERNTSLTTEKRDDLCTLSQPGYAFFAARGYKNFHLRNCKKLPGIANLEGFGQYNDAMQAGYHPCRFCKPSEKHNVAVSLPIYSTSRSGETIGLLRSLCNRFGYRCWEDAELIYMETPVGIWRMNAHRSPYRLDHINLTVDPDNRTKFHRQPRLFLSLRDVFYYIKRHDEGLSLIWKDTEYIPKEQL